MKEERFEKIVEGDITLLYGACLLLVIGLFVGLGLLIFSKDKVDVFFGIIYLMLGIIYFVCGLKQFLETRKVYWRKIK